MTFTRWLFSVGGFAAWCGALYAMLGVNSAWGMVVLAGCYVSAFCVLVNTVDLLLGRWIRRGTGQAVAPVALPAAPVLIRRVILEEVHPITGGDRYAG